MTENPDQNVPGVLGASLTVAYGMWSGSEAVSLAKILLLVGIVSCVVGLKLLH